MTKNSVPFSSLESFHASDDSDSTSWKCSVLCSNSSTSSQEWGGLSRSSFPLQPQEWWEILKKDIKILLMKTDCFRHIDLTTLVLKLGDNLP